MQKEAFVTYYRHNSITLIYEVKKTNENSITTDNVKAEKSATDLLNTNLLGQSLKLCHMFSFY
jgi:hypothetical protein